MQPLLAVCTALQCVCVDVLSSGAVLRHTTACLACHVHMRPPPAQYRAFEHVLSCRQAGDELVQTGMPQPLTDGGVHRGCTVARNLHVHMHDVTWSTCRPAAAIAGHNVTRPYFAPMLQLSTPYPHPRCCACHCCHYPALLDSGDSCWQLPSIGITAAVPTSTMPVADMVKYLAGSWERCTSLKSYTCCACASCCLSASATACLLDPAAV